MPTKKKAAQRPPLKQGDVIFDPETKKKHVCFIADGTYACFAPVVKHRKGGYHTSFKNIFVLSPAYHHADVIGKVVGLDIVLNPKQS